jgi:hypothetical protein
MVHVNSCTNWTRSVLICPGDRLLALAAHKIKLSRPVSCIQVGQRRRVVVVKDEEFVME